MKITNTLTGKNHNLTNNLSRFLNGGNRWGIVEKETGKEIATFDRFVDASREYRRLEPYDFKRCSKACRQWQTCAYWKLSKLCPFEV